MLRTIDTVTARSLRIAPDSSLGSIRRDAKLPKVRCKILPPLPQRRLPYVQSLALLIDRLNKQMHMRMRLVGMENQHISMIGPKWLDCVHNESFKAYIDARHRHPAAGCKRIAAGTINRDLAVARRILNLSARLWRDEGATLTWLATAPLIQLLENRKARKPYPLDWSEQQLLFSELNPHLRRAALFKVNTEMREKEVCQLRWDWEQRVPELDTPEIKRTVFVLPDWLTKNKEARVVVLNDTA